MHMHPHTAELETHRLRLNLQIMQNVASMNFSLLFEMRNYFRRKESRIAVPCSCFPRISKCRMGWTTCPGCVSDHIWVSSPIGLNLHGFCSNLCDLQKPRVRSPKKQQWHEKLHLNRQKPWSGPGRGPTLLGTLHSKCNKTSKQSFQKPKWMTPETHRSNERKALDDRHCIQLKLNRLKLDMMAQLPHKTWP